MSSLFSLQGKRALVTGGSRGIGLEIAHGFVAAGVDVTISSRKAEAVGAAAEELGCRGIPADLSTPDGCRGLAAEIAGPLHVLVNNAGATWGRRSTSSRMRVGTRSSIPTSRASSI